MGFEMTQTSQAGGRPGLKFVAASLIVLAAALACFFLAKRSNEYQSVALLLYAGNAIETSDSPPLSATAAAAGRLDKAHLQAVMDQFDLYPKLRRKSPDAAAEQMRSLITLKQPDIYSLQIAYRDDNSERSENVTNALAEVLESYVINGVDVAGVGTPSSAGSSAPNAPNTPVGATPVGATSGGATAIGATAPGAVPVTPAVSMTGTSNPPAMAATPAPAAASAPGAAASPAAAAPASAPVMAAPAGQQKDDGAALKRQRLNRQIAQIDVQLEELRNKESALQEESALRQQRIAALISNHGSGVRPSAPVPVVDPNAGTRASLKQQIAAENQRLASLRERYTEAYPDVQEARERLSQLEAKLAAVPPPPPPQPKVAHAELYQKEVDDLTAEESEDGDRLRSNEHEMADLQHTRDGLKVELLSVPVHTLVAAAPAPSVAPVPAPVSAPVAPVVTPDPAAKPLQNATPVKPFSILQRATSSVLVKSYSAAPFWWVGLATVVLLVFCFVPLVPARDALIEDASDLRENLPAHVKYLGDVRRIEP